MGKWSVKAKLLVTTVSIIVGFVALSLLVLSRQIGNFAEEEITRNLQQARQAYVQYMMGRRKRLREDVDSMARLPHLVARLTRGEVDAATAQARLYLVNCVRIVLANALQILGVSAPKSM